LILVCQVGDCYAPNPFDFFSATYFFKARRLFCRLRLCEFFRASCFMLILLVRRDKPAGVCGSEFRYGEGLATDAGLESCVAMLSNSDTFSSRLLEGFCVKATANSRLPEVSRPLRDNNKTVCLCLKFSTEHGKDRPSGYGLSASQKIVRTLLGCYRRPID
jgi:hypothetical protein